MWRCPRFLVPKLFGKKKKNASKKNLGTFFGGVFSTHEVGVSKNWGTPKWMVKIMENPIKIDNLGGPPLFLDEPLNYVHASTQSFEANQS